MQSEARPYFQRLTVTLFESAKINWVGKQFRSSAPVGEFTTMRISTDTPKDSELFGATLYIRDKPLCPAGGTYTIDAVDTKPSCNITGHVEP